jgi:hypothetical protein
VSTTLARPRPVPWRLAAATVLAALAGVAAGAVLAGDEPQVAAPSAPAPAPRIGLANGPARLPLPPGWKPLHRRSTLPGLETATAVRTGHGEAALDIRMPEDASLLPSGVTPALFESPEPRRLGERSVWRYALGEPRPGTAAVALVLPSTAGVVTIACSAPAAQLDRAAAGCEQAMAGLRLEGAAALAPDSGAAAAIAAPGVIAQLNRVRTRERPRLAAARAPLARSGAAARLAAGYAAAAERLRPLAAGAALPLTAALDALARAHRALAAAERVRAPRAAARAGAAIGRGEARLAAQLDQLRAAVRLR